MGSEGPASMEGIGEEKLAAFRRVRDEISTRVEEFPSGKQRH